MSLQYTLPRIALDVLPTPQFTSDVRRRGDGLFSMTLEEQDAWLVGRMRLISSGTFGSPGNTSADQHDEDSSRYQNTCIPMLAWPPVSNCAERNSGNVTDVWQGRAQIRTRGHSSRMFAKKSYKIETLAGPPPLTPEFRPKANISKVAVDFFKCGVFSGFASTQSRNPHNGPLCSSRILDHAFALNGPYSDKSLIRNLVMFQLMSGMIADQSDDGLPPLDDSVAFTPRAVPIELVLNGVYAGVYVLMETVTPKRLGLKDSATYDSKENSFRDGANRETEKRRELSMAPPSPLPLLMSSRFLLKYDHTDSPTTSSRPHLWNCAPSAMNAWYATGGEALANTATLVTPDRVSTETRHSLTSVGHQSIPASTLLEVGIDIGRALGLLPVDELPNPDYLRDMIFTIDHCTGWSLQSGKPRPFPPPFPQLDRLIIRAWIDQLFVQEMGANVDGYFFSTYLHADRRRSDGRIALGPGWDFNLAFGNCDYQGTYGGGDHIQFAHPNGGEISHVADVFRSLLLGRRVAVQIPKENWHGSGFPLSVCKHVSEDDFGISVENDIFMFRCITARRWAHLREKTWSEKTAAAIIDIYANAIGRPDDPSTNTSAADRNFARWGPISEKVWPNPEVYTTYSEATSSLKDWIEHRLSFLDDALEPLTPIKSKHGHACQGRFNEAKHDVVCLESNGLNPDFCKLCVHPIWAGDRTWFGVAGIHIFSLIVIAVSLSVAAFAWVLLRQSRKKREAHIENEVRGLLPPVEGNSEAQRPITANDDTWKSEQVAPAA